VHVQCANFTLRDLTITAQPHLAVRGVTNTAFELGQLNPTYYNESQVFITGSIFQLSYNILITNCQFLYGPISIALQGSVSNMLVSHCDFIASGGTNTFTGATNYSPTNNVNTVGFEGSVGIFGSGSPQYNINILENTYNGNANLVPSTNTPFGYVTANNTQHVAADGMVYIQGGGNFFIARNSISNYQLEGIQLGAGPSSVVGNTYDTVVSDSSCCALAVYGSGWLAATGSNSINYSTCFVGNQVYGGRNGLSPQGATTSPYFVNVSGNELSLFPPFSDGNDFPGAVVDLMSCSEANIFGNTLDYGGHGVVFDVGCTNAVIMNNNFAGAAYRSIGLAPARGSIQRANVLNNVLGEGSSFHAQLGDGDNFGWFFYQNICLNAASNSVPLFCDPISSAAHVSN
jgi:hypothetical protein